MSDGLCADSVPLCSVLTEVPSLLVTSTCLTGLQVLVQGRSPGPETMVEVGPSLGTTSIPKSLRTQKSHATDPLPRRRRYVEHQTYTGSVGLKVPRHPLR